jgi:hypothetical protein
VEERSPKIDSVDAHRMYQSYDPERTTPSNHRSPT